MTAQEDGGFTVVSLSTWMLFPELDGFRKGGSQKEEVQACHGASSTYTVSVIETHPAESEKHDRTGATSTEQC